MALTGKITENSKKILQLYLERKKQGESIGPLKVNAVDYVKLLEMYGGFLLSVFTAVKDMDAGDLQEVM